MVDHQLPAPVFFPAQPPPRHTILAGFPANRTRELMEAIYQELPKDQDVKLKQFKQSTGVRHNRPAV